MKLKLFRTNQFRRSYKKLRLTDDEELAYIDILYHLLSEIPLDRKYSDHQLKGELEEFRECHVKPDLLLLYKIEDQTLKLVDIGSHSELFS